MLKHLSISNYALIGSLDIDFDAGFSVLTGETGAGKSIILGALGLIMGQRADVKVITDGEQKCVIEAEFDIKGYPIRPIFEQNDLDMDSETCVIRRELTAAGKSRAFVNDTPTSLAVLRQLTEHLIDIHSQHENLLLSDNHFQLRVIDTLAHNKPQRDAYAADYATYKETERQLSELRERAARQSADAEFLQYQYDQLDAANLQEGEAEELEAELRQLTHVEDIQTAFVSVLQALQADEGGAIEAVEQSSDALNRVAAYQSDASELGERLHSVYIELDDIRSEIERLSEQLEYDPKRQQYVENRLDTLNTLLQKHHVENESQLILLKQQFEQQLNEISGFDDDIRRLESALQQSRSALDHAAAALSKTRCEVVPLMEQQLEQQLRLLGIPHPQFKAQIQQTTSPTATGQDDIRFLFAANKNQQLRDVSQVASGGEVSRLMLCIKAMLADSQALPTLIFDEIDTGVSGEVADAMGDIMRRMGSGIQVLAITHLPQIAVKGGAHYLVYKTDTEQRTESHIRRLNDAERVDHIAQMLSGSVVTEAARKNAQELLRHNS